MTKEECKLLQRLLDENSELRERVKALESALAVRPVVVPQPYTVPTYPDHWWQPRPLPWDIICTGATTEVTSQSFEGTTVWNGSVS